MQLQFFQTLMKFVVAFQAASSPCHSKHIAGTMVSSIRLLSVLVFILSPRLFQLSRGSSSKRLTGSWRLCSSRSASNNLKPYGYESSLCKYNCTAPYNTIKRDIFARRLLIPSLSGEISTQTLKFYINVCAISLYAWFSFSLPCYTHDSPSPRQSR